MDNVKFCTSVHCLDGRIQEAILEYLKANYQVEYVDVITEPGPCRIIQFGQRNLWQTELAFRPQFCAIRTPRLSAVPPFTGSNTLTNSNNSNVGYKFPDQRSQVFHKAEPAPIDAA